MSHAAAAALGAIAGATIFIGLPVGRIRGVSKAVQGMLNAVATGVLIFLLWDILSHAAAPIEASLAALHHGSRGFAALALIFAAGVGIGLLGLVYFNARLFGRTKHAPPPAPKTLAMMIATGLGLHNLSEGLAIGQSAAGGQLRLALVLVIGFALHNATEGFGIVGPLAGEPHVPSWRFLGALGLIAGGPTFLGTVIGQSFQNETVFAAFLALAAGSILYVVIELLAVARKLGHKDMTTWGILAGLILGFATDFILTAVGA